MRKCLFSAALIVASACAGGAPLTPYSIRTLVEIDTTGADIDPANAGKALGDTVPRAFDSGISRFPTVPLPVPASLRGTRVVTVFSIDERGQITRISLRPPRDRAYARRFVEALLSFTFRPATTADGKPVRSRSVFTMDF